MGKPRAISKRKDATASPFAEALKFVALAQRETGELYQTHVRLESVVIGNEPRNVAVCYDGMLAAGVLIDEDLNACPHTELLLQALTKSSGTVSISQTNSEKLTIQTDKFKAFVPCLAREILPAVNPDPPIAPITNEFIKGLDRIAFLAMENGSHIVTSSILIRSCSMVSTDRHLMLEYWHGIDMPTFALPKAAAIALLKCNKELKWFGFSPVTITFYFADGSWLRSNLYDGQWPDIEPILNVKSNPWPMPQNFFEGVRAVAPFNEHGWITFGKNELRSQPDGKGGATFTVSGIPDGPTFNSKYLLMLEPLAKSIDFIAQNGKATFFGDNLRGIMLGISLPKDAPPGTAQYKHDPTKLITCNSGHPAVSDGTQWTWPNCTDDCIPF